ncbi:MAG TPA: lytic transglycosylase domain-containing protein [Pyrinomonadaceae bacterium]|nr:lytic transglycosylase domain-containing protein [Pyrinomonadaceae bacterium]
MQTKRYMPLNLAGLALVAVLWQAEVRAQTAKLEEQRRDVKAPAGGHRKTGRRVVKRQQSRLRSRARMRQRALVYEPFIAAAARKHGVDPRVLWTIAYLETRFRADQISPKGARGLMQFIPSTAKRFKLTNPYDALQSIDAAARYVSELTKRFNGRLDLVLAGYNSGETAVDCFLNGRTVRTGSGKLINPRGIKTGGVPPYSETQRYVRRGALVFSRVTSAAVFSPELVAVTRMLQSPAMAISMGEQAAVDRELVDLGGTPATVLFSTSAVNTTLVQAANARLAVSSFDTVFFDVHSGARYLVKSGQIVQPLERISDDSGETSSESDIGHREISKSVYLGSRGD